MAETYAQHKARIDGAYPTPTPAWKILEPGSADQDPGAQFVTRFDDKSYSFHAHSENRAGVIRWAVRQGRNTLVAGEETAEALFVRFGHYWESLCDQERLHLATHALALDELDEAGAKAVLSADAGLTALAPITDGVVFSPPFAADILEYATSTNVGRLQLTALRAHDGQAVRWKFGNTYQNGPNGSFRLARGENVIGVRVTAEDTLATRTYIVNATRTVGSG